MSTVESDGIEPACLRPKEAARYLGISPGLLHKAVSKGQGPRKLRIGRAALYFKKDLDSFLERLLADNPCTKL